MSEQTVGDSTTQENVNGETQDEAVSAALDEAAATNGAQVDSGASTSAPSTDAPLDAIVAQLNEELAAEKGRYAELNDRFQRSSAEFQNTLRRREKQVSETIERASVQVIMKLLPILDDLALAFDHLPAGVTEEHAPWLEGFRQIQKKILQVLDDEGVHAIPLDGVFDPMLHEAISSEPSEDVPSGNIIATLRVGYEQRGRVIRPALVRVAA